MTPTLSRLHEIIHVALPEIKELKFGCRVVMEFRGSHGMHTKSQATIVDAWKEPNEWWYRINGSQLNYEAHDFLEILGRPITLADVLRVIRESPFKTNHFDIRMVGDALSFHGEWTNGSYFNTHWNLSQDLDSQLPEVWDFLLKLLTPNE